MARSIECRLVGLERMRGSPTELSAASLRRWDVASPAVVLPWLVPAAFVCAHNKLCAANKLTVASHMSRSQSPSESTAAVGMAPHLCGVRTRSWTQAPTTQARALVRQHVPTPKRGATALPIATLWRLPSDRRGWRGANPIAMSPGGRPIRTQQHWPPCARAAKGWTDAKTRLSQTQGTRPL